MALRRLRLRIQTKYPTAKTKKIAVNTSITWAAVSTPDMLLKWDILEEGSFLMSV